MTTDTARTWPASLQVGFRAPSSVSLTLLSECPTVRPHLAMSPWLAVASWCA